MTVMAHMRSDFDGATHVKRTLGVYNHHRGSACVWVVVAVAAAALSVPYREAWSRRAEEATRAKLYLQTAACTQPELAAALGGFNHCGEAAAVLANSVARKAAWDCVSPVLERVLDTALSPVPRLVWALAALGAFAAWGIVSRLSMVAARGATKMV